MPDLQVLENPKTSLASEVFSSDNKTLGKYYFNDNRTPVTFDELPKHLIKHYLQLKIFVIILIQGLTGGQP